MWYIYLYNTRPMWIHEIPKYYIDIVEYDTCMYVYIILWKKVIFPYKECMKDVHVHTPTILHVFIFVSFKLNLKTVYCNTNLIYFALLLYIVRVSR